MILTLAFAAMLQSGIAADYFPVQPGTVRTYESEDKDRTTLINTIGKPMDMGGVSAIPITESVGGEPGKTTYYRIDQSQIVIVAYTLAHPLADPFPVIKISPGPIGWDYQGKTASGLSGELLRAHGESKPSGMKKSMDKQVDTITVHLKAVIGQGMSGYQLDQTTVYGKGLGIIEQKTIFKLGTRTSKTAYKLVNIESPK